MIGCSCSRVANLFFLYYFLVLSPLPSPLTQYRLLWYAQAAVKREALVVWGEVGKKSEEKDVLSSLKEAFEVVIILHELSFYI